jgi:hypothetical protein
MGQEPTAILCSHGVGARPHPTHGGPCGELAPTPSQDVMKIQDKPTCTRSAVPTKLLQVYVDDFCFAMMQSTNKACIPLIHRASIHGICSFFFPQPVVTGHWNGNEPIYCKKLEQANGDFTSKKDMIGFTFDDIKCTIHMPLTKQQLLLRQLIVFSAAHQFH